MNYFLQCDFVYHRLKQWGRPRLGQYVREKSRDILSFLTCKNILLNISEEAILHYSTINTICFSLLWLSTSKSKTREKIVKKLPRKSQWAISIQGKVMKSLVLYFTWWRRKEEVKYIFERPLFTCLLLFYSSETPCAHHQLETEQKRRRADTDESVRKRAPRETQAI